MKISVEVESRDGSSYSYVMFEEATAVYIETTSGLAMRQDGDLPGYRITEASDDPEARRVPGERPKA